MTNIQNIHPALFKSLMHLNDSKSSITNLASKQKTVNSYMGFSFLNNQLLPIVKKDKTFFARVK